MIILFVQGVFVAEKKFYSAANAAWIGAQEILYGSRSLTEGMTFVSSMAHQHFQRSLYIFNFEPTVVCMYLTTSSGLVNYPLCFVDSACD